MAPKYLNQYLTALGNWLNDPEIVEVAVNPDGRIWIERGGDAFMHPIDDLKLDAETASDIARAVVGDSNSKVSSERPLVSGKIEYAGRPIRVQVVVPPAVEAAPALSLRLFNNDADSSYRVSYLHGNEVSLDEIRRQKLDDTQKLAREDLNAALESMIEQRLNIVISGGTSTGKTTFARNLLAHIDDGERLVTIEDAYELFPKQPNTVALEAERSENAGRSTDALLAATLRMRPDRIIVGELRGQEALTYIEAINTGHGGSITTLHAETARLAIDRLALMVLQAGTPLTFAEVKEYIGRSIDVIVQLGRSNGQRGVTELYFPGRE